MTDYTTWAGHAWLGAGCAVFIGSSGDNEPHQHHALQLAVGLEGPVRVKLPGLGTLDADGVVVAHDTPHALEPGPVGLAYFEPESGSGAALTQLIGTGHGTHVIDSDTALTLRQTLSSTEQWLQPEALAYDLVAALVSMPESPGKTQTIDPRVRAALDFIERRIADSPALPEIAHAAAISQSHLRTLFRRQVGLSIKRYRLWAKLRTALAMHIGGATLTDSAHGAGFSDAAHLTRTFREMFGTTPTRALAQLEPLEN